MPKYPRMPQIVSASPQMVMRVPLKHRWVSPPLKNVSSSFEEEDKLSSETIGMSQRWSSLLLKWLWVVYLLWWTNQT